MSELFEHHITIDQDGISVIDSLASMLDLSRQQLKKVMQNGAVWIETSQGVERVRRASKKLECGMLLHVYYNATVQAMQPPEAVLVADESAYSIWNKPGGMFSQGSKWGDHCTLYRWAEQRLQPQRPAFIVHRLDRAANGLMIIAHKKSVAAKFSAMFEQGQIYKQYQAIVEGVWQEEHLPVEINDLVDGKAALSYVLELVADEDSQTTLVNLEIKTGRKHQIRQHLSGLGFPIQGDRLYAAKNQGVDLQLRSRCLRFICPETGLEKFWCLDDIR